MQLIGEIDKNLGFVTVLRFYQTINDTYRETSSLLSFQIILKFSPFLINFK